jgi:hypothetical protein
VVEDGAPARSLACPPARLSACPSALFPERFVHPVVHLVWICVAGLVRKRLGNEKEVWFDKGRRRRKKDKKKKKVRHVVPNRKCTV